MHSFVSTESCLSRPKSMLYAGLCLCVATVASAMDPLHVQTIIDDVTKPHEATLSGVPKGYDWSDGPIVRKGNDLPSGWNATTAWGQIYREAGKDIPANTRIQIRNFELYQLIESTGKWVRLQDSDNTGIGGGAYVEDFANDASKKPNVRDEGSNSLSVKLEYGYNYHFWPNSRELIRSGGIGAMFSVFEARLILDNPGGTDDRSQARLLAGSGGDYWRSLDAKWKSDWSNNGGFALGRLKFVTNDWQYFTACTYDPIGNVGDNPPPPVGNVPKPDDTPPSAPSNLSAEAKSNSLIDLSWGKASDPESGVGTYTIYRNGAKVGTTDNTSYSDKGLDEGKKYTYRVSALNGEGIEGDKSNEASAQTQQDTTPPNIASVIAQSPTLIEVKFSEPVTKESAEKTGNYFIGDGIDISNVSLDNDNTSVTLTVSNLTLKKTYTLTVSSITDKASTPNTGGDRKEFSYTGELRITGLTVASGKSYEIVRNIADGDKQFVDRDFTFGSLGELAGMTCIRTANDDKSATGDRFLTFSVNRHVTVYVAYDNRVSAPPAWLSSWDNQGERTGISESYPDGITVYSRQFDAGAVSLGANGATEYESMYSVFVDAVGDETFVSHAAPHEALHRAPLHIYDTGRTVRLAGLQPNRAYTVTLTDARGRVSRVRTTTGSRGTASLSIASRSRGIYLVTVRSAGHRARMTAILP